MEGDIWSRPCPVAPSVSLDLMRDLTDIDFLIWFQQRGTFALSGEKLIFSVCAGRIYDPYCGQPPGRGQDVWALTFPSCNIFRIWETNKSSEVKQNKKIAWWQDWWHLCDRQLPVTDLGMSVHQWAVCGLFGSCIRRSPPCSCRSDRSLRCSPGIRRCLSESESSEWERVKPQLTLGY